MARISMKGPGTVTEISELLKEKIPECGLSCELVDSVSRGGVELLIFEKHYYRAGNFLSLTLMVSADGDSVVVDSISSGAREGILSVTWGAEEDFAMEANAVLAPMGFVVFDKSGEFDREIGIPDFFTAETTEEPLSMGDIMQRARSSARKEKSGAETSNRAESKDEPEQVKLGREEKSGLFGRKSKKPDWEY